MAMVDLNVADDEGGYSNPSDSVSQAPCIYLTAAQVKALGITAPPRAGEKFDLHGSVTVVRSSESIDGDEDDPDISLTLCLDYAELGAAQTARDPGAALYPGGGNG